MIKLHRDNTFHLLYWQKSQCFIENGWSSYGVRACIHRTGWNVNCYDPPWWKLRNSMKNYKRIYPLAQKVHVYEFYIWTLVPEKDQCSGYSLFLHPISIFSPFVPCCVIQEAELYLVYHTGSSTLCFFLSWVNWRMQHSWRLKGEGKERSRDLFHWLLPWREWF